MSSLLASINTKYNYNYSLIRNNLKKKRKLYSKTKQDHLNKNYKIHKIIFILLLLLPTFLAFYSRLFFKKENKNLNKKQSQYQQDDLTLVTAYYRIKSKHTPEEYLRRIKNFVLLNRSIVYFTNKEFMPTIKELRPKELHNKTVFIEVEMEEFYSYKNFYEFFKESFKDDFENRFHTVPLYTVWAEKCNFVKKAILQNYFQSKCFYWIDAGYFFAEKSESEMQKYINDWPKINRCFSDKRIVLGTVREYTESEKKNFVNFDPGEHYRLPRTVNTCGGFFGGQIESTLKFIEYYYEAVRQFIKRKIFCGKEQTVFAYVAFAHPEIVELILFKNYDGFKEYLS